MNSALPARMVMTMFLFGLVALALVEWVEQAGGTAVIVVVALVLLIVQLFGSDRIAMATMGVKEVTPTQEPELHQGSSSGCACRPTCRSHG